MNLEAIEEMFSQNTKSREMDEAKVQPGNPQIGDGNIEHIEKSTMLWCNDNGRNRVPIAVTAITFGLLWDRGDRMRHQPDNAANRPQLNDKMFNNFHKAITSLLLAAIILMPHTALAQQPTGPAEADNAVSLLAKPAEERTLPGGHRGISGDIVLLLDNSGSMKANDPDFLMADAVSRFVSQLDFNTRLGIVIFDQSVRLSYPLTGVSDTSRAEMLASLEQINYKGQHTNSPDGLERAIYELKLHAREDAERFIIFLTDGIVDTGDKQKDASKLDWMRKELAADAKNNGIRVFGIAFTDNADFQLIQSLAQQTDAKYYRASTASDISPIFDRIQNTIEATRRAAMEAAKPPPPPAPVRPPPPPKPIIVKIPEQTTGTDAQTLYILYGIAALLLMLLLALLLRGRLGQVSATPESADMPHVKLIDVSGITDKKEHPVTTPITQVGRIKSKETAGVSHIVIPEKSISRHHAVIEYRNHAFWLMDQGSGNGTRLNDIELREEQRLKHGDRLAFGDFVFEFTEPDMEQSDATVVQASGGNQAEPDTAPNPDTDTAPDMENTMLMSSEEPPDSEADSEAPDIPSSGEADEDMTLAEFERLFDDMDEQDKEK